MSNIKSIYIHIPFCNQICTYCDFCKLYYNKKWVTEYLKALKYEMNLSYKNEKISTIYIGGGTPSSLTFEELTDLFCITNNILLEDDYEFTIECNIEDITEEKLILFKNNKVNRLSIGVQSFNNKILNYLGRKYDETTILKKIKLAKKYFKNINIDLIYAIKNQSLDDLNLDLEKFISLDIPHISCYSLIIENNTILKNNNEEYIDEELDRKMYDFICNKLKKQYSHYEISNFSKKGYESKHNLCYWNNLEYYGFGLSASGYINNIRYTNTKNLSKYLKCDFDKENEFLNKKDKMQYELIVGFRKIDGINKLDFYNKYNSNLKDLYNIRDLVSKNILLENKDSIYINPKYIYTSNDILVNFI